MRRNILHLPFLIWAGIFALLPLLLSLYQVTLAVDVLVFGLLAMSLDFVLGYAGLVSFGHAAFFGLGAYATALTLLYVSRTIWLALIFSVLAAGLFALLVSYVSIRGRGIYFAILTLIFAEVVHRIFFYTPELGGADGIHGVPAPTILAGSSASWALDNPKKYYYFVLIVLFICYVLLRTLTTSYFGKVLQGIRENEERARFLGYSVRRYKIVACVISAAVAAASGSLYTGRASFAAPDLLQWTVSGEAVVMVLIGGQGTLLGPLIGAAFFIVLMDVVSSYWGGYFLVIGLTLIFIVLFMPKGIIGFAPGSLARRKRGKLTMPTEAVGIERGGAR